MKIKYRVCDACFGQLKDTEKDYRNKEGITVYVRHGWKVRKIDICESCFRFLDRLPSEQEKKLKECK